MPTILQLFGLKFRVYVRDHEPIHVHVISQDGEAKIQVEGEGDIKSRYETKRLEDGGSCCRGESRVHHYRMG